MRDFKPMAKKKMKKPIRRGPLFGAALLFLVFIACLWFIVRNGWFAYPPAPPEPPTEVVADIEVHIPAPGGVEATVDIPLSSPGLPRVAIVIDDLGYNMVKVTEFLEVDAPITVAVLPHLERSREVAARAHSMGRDVLLHLPMEPRDTVANDPGQGALLTGMDREEVLAQLAEALDAFPDYIGVNNHMGSRFTEDEELMRTVLEVVKQRGVFFLDSRTSGSSVALKVARELGVPAAERSVFLDNERDEQYIRERFEDLVHMAERGGSAIAIGHPYPETLKVLKEFVGGGGSRGVEVVGISDLIE
jgi:polysaccharide deacetylase 2 family uncharacterized protein YibQ